jgi:hypothetical protein
MVTMSGLPWGIDSRHKNRDWGRVVCGLVAEAFLVRTYRKKLLDACASARALRVRLHGVFLKRIDYVVDEEAPSGSGHAILKVWEFADKIGVGEIEANVDTADIQALQTDWQASLSFSKISRPEKRDAIQKMLDPLINSKYLHCSEPGVEPGTVESIVSFAIGIIESVSDDCHIYADGSDVRSCRSHIKIKLASNITRTRLGVNSRTRSDVGRSARQHTPMTTRLTKMRMGMLRATSTWRAFPLIKKMCLMR